MCKTIKQKVHFKAPPEVVYSLLTDSKKYASLTGKKAQIGKSAGAPFSVYGGQATGIIVELVRNKRIVQAWRGHSLDRKSTRLNSSHTDISRMPSSA